MRRRVAQGLDIGSSNVSLTYDGHFAKYRGSLEHCQEAGWIAFTAVNSRRALQHEIDFVSHLILMDNDTTGRDSQFLTDFGDFGKRVVIEAVKKLKARRLAISIFFTSPIPDHAIRNWVACSLSRGGEKKYPWPN